LADNHQFLSTNEKKKLGKGGSVYKVERDQCRCPKRVGKPSPRKNCLGKAKGGLGPGLFVSRGGKVLVNGTFKPKPK